MSDYNAAVVLALNKLVNDPKHRPLLTLIKAIRNGIV